MDKKKSLIGAGALTALATIALVSCGGGKTKTYTITLDVNDSAATLNTDTETYTVKTASELVEALANVKPTKTGYTFVGWYLDEDATVKLTADTDLKSLTAEEDGAIYIYAAFEVADFTVTFDLKGNATTAAVADKSTESVKYNGSVTAAPTITTPAKDSGSHEMTFTGWYTSAADAASGDTTKAVTPSSVKITGNTTFYAGWTITKIDTEAAFLEYINAKSQTVNAYIANDITLTAAIQRTAAAASANENLSTNGTDQTNSMSAKLYGDNHTITGLSINSDLKSSGLWGKFSGTIQDINFKSVTATTTGQNAAVLVGTVEDGATFTDISFDGVEFTNTASNGYAAVVAAQVKDAQVNATFDGVTIKGLDMECVKYSAAVLATVVGANATINFTDCLVQGEIVGTGEAVGFLFGYANKDKSTGSTLTFDGVIASGSITADKNVGAIVGNVKDTATTVVIKNSAVIGFTGNITSTTASETQVNTFVGQNNGTLTLDAATCYYQDFGSTLIRNGSVSTSTVKQGTEISLETLATKTLSSNVTLAYENKTLTATVSGQTITVADPTVVDLSTVTTTVTSSASTTNVNGTAITTQGSIPFYESVIAGSKGNGVQITFSAPTLGTEAITDFNGLTVSGGDLKNVTYDTTNGTVTGYIILTAAEVASITTDTSVTKTVTITWFSNSVEVATPVTYQITFPTGFCSFQAETAAGQISLAAIDATYNDTEALVAAADGTTKLNITSGQIDFDVDGNYVYVSIAKPDTIVSPVVSKDTITVTGGTLKSYESNVAVIRVKITAAGDKKVTISWNNAFDPDEYTINVAEAVTIEEGATVYDETFDATKITVPEDTKDKAALTQALLGDFFTLVGSGEMRVSSKKVTSVEFKDSGLQFTVTDSVVVTAVVSSTGGSNMSTVALYDKTNATVAATSISRKDGDVIGVTNNVYDVYGTDKTTIVYTLAAGTYTLKGVNGASTGGTYSGTAVSSVTSVGRGARFFTLSVVTAAKN